MLEEERGILLKSAEWIKKNRKANLGDVPKELLEEWIDDGYEGKIDKDNTSTLAMSVFLFAFIESKGKNGQLEVSERDIEEHFSLWQTKLNLQSLHNCGLITLEDKPVKLFSFSKNEKIKVIEVKTEFLEMERPRGVPIPFFNPPAEQKLNEEKK